jgi:pyridoxal phosphate enzyme (YggS family)
LKRYGNINKVIGRIGENLNRILSRIETIKELSSLSHEVRLLAVSKLQSPDLILEAYNSGHRDFAENYIDELVSKAETLPKDIRWHMIGHIQSNKLKKILSVENLVSIHSLDSKSLAQKLNGFLAQANKVMNVFIQVNTSGENTKSGINPEDLVEFGRHVIDNLQFLKLAGLMTIGEKGSSEDFVILSSCRKALADSLGVPEDTFELSMGMSADYEAAIQHGSNYVRVGTSIFGERVKH